MVRDVLTNKAIFRSLGAAFLFPLVAEAGTTISVIQFTTRANNLSHARGFYDL